VSGVLESALAALGGRVLAASLVAALLGGLVALVLRAPGGASPTLRAWIWWLVAARALAELAGVPPIELAWLPAEPPIIASALRAVPATSLDRRPPAAIAHPADTTGETSRAEPVRGTVPWRELLGASWALVALAALARSGRELACVANRRKRAVAVEDPAALAALARVAATLGVRRRVRLASSAEIEVPQVTGLVRVTVLLPQRAALAGEELEWTLAHELAHVRRCESLVALVPFLAERLFIWHPLVRLAASEYALASEQACDALVVGRLRPAPERYGRLLLRFALNPSPAPAVATWPLARRPLQRRLEMIAESMRSRRPSPWTLALGGVLLLALAVPLRLVASTTLPAPALPVAALPVSLAAELSAPALEVSTVPPPPPAAPAPPAIPAPATPAAPPSRPTPALAPVPPLPSPEDLVAGLDAVSLALSAGGRTLQMNAPEEDLELAARLERRDGQPALVVRDAHGNRRVVRDPKTIEALREAVERPVRLAHEQARLASRQAELAATAAREAARATAEQARLASEQATRIRELVQEKLAEQLKELEAHRGELEASVRQAQELRQEEIERLEANLAGIEANLRQGLERHSGEFHDLELARQQLEQQARQLRAEAEKLRQQVDQWLRELAERAPTPGQAPSPPEPPRR
jgi:bla regulator protein BlaR1